MNSWITFLAELLQRSQIPMFVLDTACKSFLLLAIAAAISWCARRAAASTRHLVWFIAAVAVLCLPAFSWFVPNSQNPLWAVDAVGGGDNEITVTLALTPADSGPSAIAPSPALLAGTGASLNATASRPDRRLSAHLRTRWVAGGLVIWLGGALVVLFSIASGVWQLGGFRRVAAPLSDREWADWVNRLRAELGLRRQIVLLQSTANVMPVTWGWWRPVILLPADAGQWSAERRRVVLLHELAHVKRCDCLTQAVARLACSFYWFNPLVWLAARRMSVERERACDDLVLNRGYKPSEYAAQLLEIARSFTRVPQTVAIAMARSSSLETRITALMDPSRSRRALPGLVVLGCCFAGIGLVAAIAAQKAENMPANIQARPGRPWFDQRLCSFFSAKAAQARQLAAGEVVAPEVWPYFDAGIKGDWLTTTNLWVAMRRRAHQYEGSTADATLDKVWSPILETELAWEQFANWTQQYVLAYGNDIIQSIPPGGIYFGGTDPGRGVITAMSEDHAQADPFFTLTQNALADGTYLDYLRAMYGSRIDTPTADDSQNCFQEYTRDAERRLKENKLKPGEDVSYQNGKIAVKGQVAVMSINGLLTKVIFDRNPDREFYVEESFPLDWMYPHLSPNGLIMKINREPLPDLSEGIVRQDHQYWSQQLRRMLGDWLDNNTPVSQVTAFAQKVYLQHDLDAFRGDPQFVQDSWAQKAYSKLRSSIAGVYAWRMANAQTPEEKQRMAQEADFAFRQAFALCPSSPEALFRYANLLVESKRNEDARLLAETSLKMDPKNTQVQDLLAKLKSASEH